MNKNRIPAVLKFLFAIFIPLLLVSCSKEVEPEPEESDVVTAQILTAHPWKVFEERGVHGGNLIYYLRGGTNNTQSFDNEFITFNANNTGILTTHSGTQFNFTWTFVNADNTKLTWTVQNSPATYTITWDNMRRKNGNLYHDQYFTDGNTGLHSHTQQIRMPK